MSEEENLDTSDVGDVPKEPAVDSGEYVATKPEGLEDSFWDSEKNTVRMEQLIKSHNDTRAMIHKKEEDFRERFVAELQGNRPESPEAYEIRDLGIDAPDGYEFKFPENDPMIDTWKAIAFQNNLSNDQFMEGIRTWVKSGMENRPDPEAEIKALGENAQERLQRIDLLLNKHLQQEDVNEIADFANTARGVEIIERLVEGISKARLPDIGDGEVGSKNLSRAELEEMMRDPRYSGIGRPRDPEYIRAIMQGFDKLAAAKRKAG